jgi:hypothetical protein
MKKTKTAALITAIVMCISMLFSACGGSSDSTLDITHKKTTTTTAKSGSTTTTTAKGSSSSSGSASNNTTAVATTAKTVTSTVKVTSDGVVITWGTGAAKSGFVLSAYIIYRKTSDSADWDKIATVSSTDRKYTDEKGKASYTYTVKASYVEILTTKASSETTKTTAPTTSSKKFTGRTVGTESSGPLMSSDLNCNIGNVNYVMYIVNAFIANKYCSSAADCQGYLATVISSGDAYRVYIFQFDNPTTWNSSTLSQVHIFAKGESSYFSFFVKDTGTESYMNQKSVAQSKWKSYGISLSYDKQEAQFKTMADNDNAMQDLITASWS